MAIVFRCQTVPSAFPLFRMRAEIPGKFSALPTRAYAMYAPELKGNSDEIKLVIED
jgi:alpha-2-macroglobulin